jgi:hypothetical protein
MWEATGSPMLTAVRRNRVSARPQRGALEPHGEGAVVGNVKTCTPGPDRPTARSNTCFQLLRLLLLLLPLRGGSLRLRLPWLLPRVQFR